MLRIPYNRQYSFNEDSMDILSMKDPSKKSDIFRVTFAFYTASPHLMIMPAKEREEDVQAGLFPGDYTEVEDEHREELLRVARIVIETFQLSKNDIILSVRVGTWKKNDDMPFHARLCFEARGAMDYLRIFDEMKTYPPMCNFWPSKWIRFASRKGHPRQMNRCWWNVRTDTPVLDDIDIEELHRWQVLNGTKNWKITDKDALDDAVRADPPLPKTCSYLQMEKVKFHEAKPQIGLPWKAEHAAGDPALVQQYIKELYKLYAGLMAQHYSGGSDAVGCNGGHICVSLGDNGLPGFDHSDGPVLGYVHISADSFYRILPEDRRRNWYTEYRHWDGVVYT